MCVAVLHLITLIANRNLRQHWKQLAPAPSDLWQAIENFRWLLGLRRDHPMISSHSYVEKAEYWAVVWGTVLMSFTGIMLWAHNFFLRYLPKLALDVASSVHFYEAVLASLAIVVWHFYYVIFDPEVYPMDPAWITGYSVRLRVHDEEAEGATESAPENEDEKKNGNDKPDKSAG
jgi:cytochrome b subunit of formate dehydrogenase